MKKELVAIVAIAIMILVFVPFVDEGSDGANQPDTNGFTVTGYIKEGAALYTNEEATVVLTVITSSGERTYYDRGISDGYFIIENIPLGSSYYISFSCEGYNIVHTSGCLDPYATSTLTTNYAYEVINWPEPIGNVYQITSFANGTDCIGVYSTYGKISGTVAEGSYKISGARVDILEKDTDKIINTAFTKNGSFTITNCPTGTYDVKVTMEGYENYKTEITVLAEPEINTLNIQLEITSSGGILGIDLPHFLMIVGGAVAGILIIASVIYRIRMKKGKTLVIYDDNKEKE